MPTECALTLTSFNCQPSLRLALGSVQALGWKQWVCSPGVGLGWPWDMIGFYPSSVTTATCLAPWIPASLSAGEECLEETRSEVAPALMSVQGGVREASEAASIGNVGEVGLATGEAVTERHGAGTGHRRSLGGRLGLEKQSKSTGGGGAAPGAAALKHSNSQYS